MPRKEIELPYTIDHLSILDANGRVEQKLMPHLSIMARMLYGGRGRALDAIQKVARRILPTRP